MPIYNCCMYIESALADIRNSSTGTFEPPTQWATIMLIRHLCQQCLLFQFEDWVHESTDSMISLVPRPPLAGFKGGLGTRPQQDDPKHCLISVDTLCICMNGLTSAG